MFDLERDFCGSAPPGLVSAVGQRQVRQQSLEQRQRDIFETHRHRTYAVAYYMTGNEIDAETVLTCTFVQAFARTPEPDGRQVDTAMVEQLRERMPVDATAAPPAHPETEGLGGRNIKRTELEEALKGLPPNERLIFLLRDVEGYPAEKVAELLVVPRQQVERTLFSARIRMRGVLAANSAPDLQAA